MRRPAGQVRRISAVTRRQAWRIDPGERRPDNLMSRINPLIRGGQAGYSVEPTDFTKNSSLVRD
jgi:hypothetical protein